MTTSSRVLSFLVVSCVVASQPVLAQLPTPDLSRITPSAGRIGESLKVSLHGSHLEELSELRFTHPGIVAHRVTQPGNEFLPNPCPVGSEFQVTIGDDVPPGIYEARAVCYLGITTARPFVVAPNDSNEVMESSDHSTRDTALEVELNSVISGTVSSRGIDWYRFTAPGGQRVLLEILAERIDSRMDGLLIAYDSDGREVARNRDTYGRDPFLEVSPDQDTEYFLAVSDILYRGGPEHFYRLSISNKPHIDFIEPPMGEPGSTKMYSLYGRNLPGGQPCELLSGDGMPLEKLDVEIALPSEASVPAGYFPGEPRQGVLPGMNYRIGESNAVRIGFATAPVVPEQAEADLQVIDVPSEVAGRFDRAADDDRFRFTARKGATYCIEVIADRMLSPVDPYLMVHKVTVADDGAEVAVAGRSNAGKSSAINIIVNRRQFARTSKTPGRTQLVNFFGLRDGERLVDLPGYGFAKVPREVKQAWTRQLELYLQKRQSLRGLVLLMDVRHPLQPFDEQMLEWALAAHMPIHILLTKADKLKRGAASKALLEVKKATEPYRELVSVQLFSALKHQGHAELVAVLNAWLTDASVYDDDDDDTDPGLVSVE